MVLELLSKSHMVGIPKQLGMLHVLYWGFWEYNFETHIPYTDRKHSSYLELSLTSIERP